jgi:thioredoxin 1
MVAIGLRPSRIALAPAPAPRHPDVMTTTHSIPVVDDDHFNAEVLEAEGPVLVDFTAAWCPPCRMMKPVLEELAAERDDLAIVQVDVEDSTITAARYGVLSMPTFILFRDGEPVTQLVGARPKRRLERELDAAL